MKISKKIGLIAFLVISLNTVFADETIKLTNEASIDAVIKEMTLEEKAKLLFGAGAKRISGIAGGTYAIPRLGIPEIDVADGPAGVRFGGITGETTRGVTAYPIPTAMASTWDMDGIEKIGQTMGYELKEYGIDLLLGPALNIQRDPLGGRNFEYYTEDPYLNGKIATAFVNGVQSNDVGATLKHYAANNTETFRLNSNQIISERALREIYLPGFEMAVKNSNPWSVMSSYPGINGSGTGAQSKYLQTDILRDEWNFDGFVMSDWGAVKLPLEGVKAGTDLIMPAGNSQAVIDAVKAGTFDEKLIDRNVKKLLSVIIKTPTFKGYKASNNPDKKSYIPFVRQIAADGMVLLKNENSVLPIASTKKIALFGKNAYDFIVGGGGSAEVTPDYKVQLTEGLKAAGYKFIEKTGTGTKLIEGITAKDAADAAKSSDIGLLSIGRYSSEGSDKYSMDMLDDEIALIKNVSAAYHQAGKKLVVLLNIGAPLEIASWDKYADAILLTWQPGQEAGNAVADILSGKVNPNGKLTETFPVKYADSPSFGNTTVGKEVIYGEGIFVGYRYYDTKGIAPQYPFGFGLSYTTFEYSNFSVDKSRFDIENDEEITVTVDVTNTGKVKGKEIVQLYVNDVATVIAQKPYQELKAFDKVELEPGETKTVTLTIDKRALSAYDVNTKNWVIEPGKFVLRVGSSSRDIREETLIKAAGISEGSVNDNTPWGVVQMSGKAAKVVAKYIGDKNMNLWYMFAVPNRNETFGNVMRVNFEGMAELKGNKEKQKEMLDKIIAEINDL